MAFYTDEEERFLKLIGQISTETLKETKPTKPETAEVVTQAPATEETGE